ncbi:hypothetical protein D9613_006744 [Agrocybe pediades]|uniref:Uncharacterized protein n=1 Tax=Agrocybe pediades TaxID=84607 RepID=A0A8H4VIB2_9AGAR|nr:hypothetical protein D9613_006744 [Agrocybe pediades]
MAQKFTGIQALFFNFYARLYTLRVVILCALVALLSSLSFMQSKVFNKAWAILLVFVIFHHILSAVKLKYISGILNVVLTLGETIGSVYYARKLPNIKPYSPEIDAYHVVASWILVAGLSILSIFKLATVTKAPISLI